MYKICIVYYDKNELLRLEQLFNEYERNHKVEFSIFKYEGEEAYLESKDTDSDLVLLENSGSKLQGFETAKKIRKIRPAAMVAFYADTAQYALAGYEYAATAYLIKPVQPQPFNSFLKRIIFGFRRVMNRKISIKGAQGAVIVPISEVLYVGVKKHTLFYHLHPKSMQQQKIIQVRGSLQDAESLLQRYDFVRCSNGFLVNMNHILSILNNEVYLPEAMLPIGRSYKIDFVERVMKYLTAKEVRKL